MVDGKLASDSLWGLTHRGNVSQWDTFRF